MSVLPSVASVVIHLLSKGQCPPSRPRLGAPFELSMIPSPKPWPQYFLLLPPSFWVNAKVRDRWTWKEWFAFNLELWLLDWGWGVISVGAGRALAWDGFGALVVVASSCLGAVTEGQVIFSCLACGAQERRCAFSHHPLSFSRQGGLHTCPSSDLLLPLLLHTRCSSPQPFFLLARATLPVSVPHISIHLSAPSSWLLPCHSEPQGLNSSGSFFSHCMT